MSIIFQARSSMLERCSSCGGRTDAEAIVAPFRVARAVVVLAAVARAVDELACGTSGDLRR